MSRFADAGESVAEALRSGAPLEVAAEGAGVSVSTVRGWLRRGKRDPSGEFGAFVRSAEAGADVEEPMSVEEIERTLATVIRTKRSVTAMKLWLDLHPQDRPPAGDDPFAEFEAAFR